MKITKRQLKRIIKEEVGSSYFRKSSVPGPLTESQLNEIAPIIMGIGRAIAGAASAGAKVAAKAGSAIAKTFTKTILPALKKGGPAISKMLKNSPEFLEHAVELLSAAADKVPDLKDLDFSTPEALTTALEGDKASVIEDVLQQSAPDLEKAVQEESYRRQLRMITEKSCTMKITKRQLRRIIKEEKTRLLKEKWGGMGEESSGSALIHFAKAYANLGPQVQEQVEAIVSAYFNIFPDKGFVSQEEIYANPEFEDVAMQQNPAAIEMARKGLEYTNFSGVDAHEELLQMDDALEVALKLLRGEEEE
jgi:hypothetical protein